MAVAELQKESLLTVKEESQLTVVFKRFIRHKLAVAGIIVLLIFIFAAFLAPFIAPYDPYKQNLAPAYSNPSSQHILGTDELGRDVFSRLLYAARISLFITFIVNFSTETFGALLGAISGYFGKWVDSLIQRTIDLILTIPTLPLLLFFSAMLRGINIPGLPAEWSSAVVISIVLIVFGWTGAARQVRAMVLTLKEQDFAQASKALGLNNSQIILRHMIPNSLAPVIVGLTLGLGTIIVVEAALSFLGFGITPPVPTWGNMLQNVQERMWQQPWLAFYPGLCIFLCSLSFNYVGDALRDSLDPRLKR
jgi:peptide/nickel transport system permease protein